MSAWTLEDIGVDIRRARSAVTFYYGYAQTCLSELETGRAAEAGHAERKGAEAAAPVEAWVAVADAASSFREAAQWAVALGDPRAPQLLTAAARCYAQIDQPYGYFLGVAANYWPTLEAPPMTPLHVEQLAAATGAADSDRAARSLPEAWLHPQQQAYAFLAACAEPATATESHGVLLTIGDTSTLRLSTLPMGALGAPARSFWQLARTLLEPDDDTTSELLDLLTGLAIRFGSSAELARANDYLWANAAASIDIADLDIFAVVLLAVRRLGANAVRDACSQLLDSLPFLAGVPLRCAIEFMELSPSGE